jgi:radical SAM superfamily enzyme YgiQ (UPF0313 family)
LITDECFYVSKDHIYEFCKEIKKLSKEFPWELKWGCQLMVFLVDAALLKTMKESGCDTISYGFESFSPVVLKSMRKPITPEQIDYAFKETLKAGIGVQANFILGDVAETKETAKKTVDYWEKNSKGQIGLGFVQPYPGSDLYKHCIKKGIIKDKLKYIKNEMGPNNVVNMTESMSDKDIKKLSKKLLKEFSRNVKFISPISVKIENKNKKTYSLKVKCPFCKNIINYGNCFIPNKFTYGFNLICRECAYRFFVVSILQKLAYKYYYITRLFRDFQLKITSFIKKKHM